MDSNVIVGSALCLIALTCGASGAAAHVTLETRQGAVGTYYKAVFGLSHGCEGSPTVKVTIRLPEGVIAAKPMPKPGWKIATRTAAYKHGYTLHGQVLRSGVVEVEWSGSSLADAHFDEFTFKAYLAETLEPGTTLHFPVVQQCAKGVNRWVEIPTARAGL